MGDSSNSASGNTGSGGGGSGFVADPTSGGNGGSGVVIIKIPNSYTAQFSVGVSSSSTSVSNDTVYTITSGGTSDTITFY
jgi:hypothetical protein